MKKTLCGALSAALLIGLMSVMVSCGPSNSPTSSSSGSSATFTPTATFTPQYSSGPTTLISTVINQPYGIAYDSLSTGGNLWLVGESNPGTIYQYTTAGVNVINTSYYFSTTGQYNFPNQVSVDPSGYLYVSDYGNNQIEVLNSAGVYIGVALSGLTKPTDAVVNSAGTTLYVVEETNPNVTILTYAITGSSYPKTYTPTANSFPTSGSFDPPRAICMALDPSGNVYVGDFNNSTIIKYGPTGASPSIFIPYVASTTSPWGFVFDSSGNIFVNQQTAPAYIREYSSTGSAGVSIGGFPATTNLTGLAIDGSGNLFASDSFHGYVYKVAK